MKKSLLFITLLFFAIIGHADDQDILASLYEATDGENWTNPWDLSADISTWEGVTVNASNRVTELKLSNRNLSGILPESIWGLTALEVLDLNFNFQLTGTLSSAIQNLTSLKNIRLTNNNLTGVFPPEIFSITTLESLKVSGQFSGSLVGIENLVNLKEVTLNGSDFDAIPNGFWSILSLEDVLIGNTGLIYSIPASIDQLTNLKRLYISGNATQDIPVEITNLTSLEQLTLQGVLTGVIPESIGNMIGLERLTLSGGLTQEIPLGITNLTNLISLNLGPNELTGTIPEDIGNLTKLEFLSLSNNLFDTEIPNSVVNLVNIKTLWLLDCGLTGTIPENIGNLIKMESIRVDNNALEGEIPSSFTNLISLKTALLGSNNLTGEIPANIGDMEALTSLYLYSNNLTGELPNSFINLTNLKDVFLYNNSFEGVIPNLTALNIDKLLIRGNEFVFEDLESDFVFYNDNVSNFQYSPQGLIDEEETISLLVGQELQLSVEETQSTNNSYQWQKNGVNISGATERMYTIENATISDIGEYRCFVTNSIVTGLTLIRNKITVDITLSNSDVTNDQFNVYPNPATNEISIAFKSISKQNVTANLYGIQGNLIVKQENISQYDTIDISELSTGVYILKLNTDREIYTSRIIKQ